MFKGTTKLEGDLAGVVVYSKVPSGQLETDDYTALLVAIEAALK